MAWGNSAHHCDRTSNRVRGVLHWSAERVLFENAATAEPVLFFAVTDISEWTVTPAESSPSSVVTSATCDPTAVFSLTVRFRCSRVRTGLAHGVVAPLQLTQRSSDHWAFHLFLRKDDSEVERALQCVGSVQNTSTFLHEKELRIMRDAPPQTAVFPVKRCVPLRSERGVLHIGETEAHFQPLVPVKMSAGKESQRTVLQCRSIGYVFPRSIAFESTGVDLYTAEDQLLLSCEACSAAEAAHIIAAFERVASVRSYTVHVHDVVRRWQQGALSNYDYLYRLNQWASRSRLDASQYPVMPWILTAYDLPHIALDDLSVYRDLSKPVGALQPARLAQLKLRRDALMELQGDRYLYATHYSSAAVVAYYLMRSCPWYLLCLQQGQLDKPQRLFESVAAAWRAVQENAGDYKELTPEFFDEDAFSALCAAPPFDLGTKDSGDAVSAALLLPSWATSPRHFARVHRQALESPVVSAQLHHWIDLIFGYQQDGAAAEEADNTFHPFAYPQPQPRHQQRADEVGATHALAPAGLVLSPRRYAREFGSVPVKLFCSPHPTRAAPSPYVHLTSYAKSVCGDTRAEARELASLQALLDTDSEDSTPYFVKEGVAGGQVDNAAATCVQPSHSDDAGEAVNKWSAVSTFASNQHNASRMLICVNEEEPAQHAGCSRDIVVVVLSEDRTTVTVFDGKSGQRLRVLSEFTSPIEHIAQQGGTAVLLFTSDGAVYTLHLSTLALLERIQHVPMSVVCVSAIEDWCVALGDTTATVRVWRIASPKQEDALVCLECYPWVEVEAPSPVVALRCSNHPEGEYAALAATAGGEVLCILQTSEIVSLSVPLHDGQALLSLELCYVGKSNEGHSPSPRTASGTCIMVLLSDEIRWLDAAGTPLRSVVHGHSLQCTSLLSPPYQNSSVTGATVLCSGCEAWSLSAAVSTVQSDAFLPVLEHPASNRVVFHSTTHSYSALIDEKGCVSVYTLSSTHATP